MAATNFSPASIPYHNTNITLPSTWIPTCINIYCEKKGVMEDTNQFAASKTSKYFVDGDYRLDFA